MAFNHFNLSADIVYIFHEVNYGIFVIWAFAANLLVSIFEN